MQVGGVIFVIVLNCIIIFVLYRLLQESLEKRIKHLKNQIQDLEDLVAAIIEEFEEIAAVTDAKATEVKNAILETANIESDNQISKSFLASGYNGDVSEVMSGVSTSTPGNSPDKIDPTVLTYSNSVGESEPEAGVEFVPHNKSNRPVNDQKHQRILELWEQGISIEEIAKTLGTGRGEIQLILGIYRRS